MLKFLYVFALQMRSNFLRGHAKTGPFLPPSRLIARDEEIDPDVPKIDQRQQIEADRKYYQ